MLMKETEIRQDPEKNHKDHQRWGNQLYIERQKAQPI